MANDHPFQHLFESFGRLPAAHAESVNRKAGEELSAVLDRPVDSSGRCILLKAPRAGYGKTHLLSRIQHQFAGSHEFIALHASGTRIDALSVTEDAIKSLVRPLPAAGGLTVLDLVTRQLFAFALQPLVVSGEVPCQDREGALSALRLRPVETFDFHHPNAVTAHWAKENFEVLGPRLSTELSHRTGLPIREVSFWVNSLFRYAATPIDHPGRAGALALEVTGESLTEGAAADRLVSLLGLLSLLMRVVLVADDLEGFSADESAALKFSAFVTGVRQAADRIDVILSLNEDVWENAFLPRLSGGLADRLSEVVIGFEPLTDDDIVALFESRAPGLGANVFEVAEISERHPRALIRAAGAAWEKAATGNGKVQNEVPVVPVIESEPAAKMEAEMEVEAAKDLVESAPAADFGPPQPIFPAPRDFGPESGFFTDPAFAAPQQAQVPESQFAAESAFAPVFEAPPTPPEVFTPVFDTPPAPPVFTPVFDEQSATSAVFTPIFEEKSQGPPVGIFESYHPAPAQWGSGVYDAQILSDPEHPAPPFSEPSSPAAFHPVFDEEPTTPAFQPEPSSAPPMWGTPVFEPAVPSQGFPPQEPAVTTENPTKEEGDRVDDLLRQFRERYGR
jgi:hypothetical protein